MSAVCKRTSTKSAHLRSASARVRIGADWVLRLIRGTEDPYQMCGRMLPGPGGAPAETGVRLLSSSRIRKQKRFSQEELFARPSSAPGFERRLSPAWTHHRHPECVWPSRLGPSVVQSKSRSYSPQCPPEHSAFSRVWLLPAATCPADGTCRSPSEASRQYQGKLGSQGLAG